MFVLCFINVDPLLASAFIRWRIFQKVSFYSILGMDYCMNPDLKYLVGGEFLVRVMLLLHIYLQLLKSTNNGLTDNNLINYGFNN